MPNLHKLKSTELRLTVTFTEDEIEDLILEAARAMIPEEYSNLKGVIAGNLDGNEVTFIHYEEEGE